jgi:hypothetical protein
MRHTFKVGDVIEAIQDDRKLVGTIMFIDAGDLAVEMIEFSDLNSIMSPHGCELDSIDRVPSGNGWWVYHSNATLSKSHVINKILGEI